MQQATHRFGVDVTVVCHADDFMGDGIEGGQHVVTLATRGAGDKEADKAPEETEAWPKDDDERYREFERELMPMMTRFVVEDTVRRFRMADLLRWPAEPMNKRRATSSLTIWQGCTALGCRGLLPWKM
jgi:hypothetical protein